MIRPVEEVMPLPTGFMGCTILGDGHAVPLADTSKLIDWVLAQRAQQNHLSDNPYQVASAPESKEDNRVLVIDDSINIRRVVTRTLEQAGYQVEQAKDGQEAVDKLLNGLWVDAILCDVEMPRLDGYGFLAKIKAYPKFEALPVVMMTSLAGNKHRETAYQLGALAYLTKPYDNNTLLRTLDQLIHQSV